MPLPEIRKYTDLVRTGPGTEAERFEILRRHEQAVRAQVAELQDALAVIEQKVRAYANALAEGTAAALFVDDTVDDMLLGQHEKRPSARHATGPGTRDRTGR